MVESDIPKDKQEALLIVCLYLAQSGNTYGQLGFKTQSEAFNVIGKQFNVPPRTVQNERDSFDAFTDSDRVGWQNNKLPPRLLSVFEVYSQFSTEKLLHLAQQILKTDWQDSMSHMLPDLADVVRDCKKRIGEIDETAPILINSEDALKLIDAFKELNKNDSIDFVGNHTFVIETNKEQTRYISIQEIPVLTILSENMRALELYRVELDKIAAEMGFSNRTGDGSDFFSKLPNPLWKNSEADTDFKKFADATKKILTGAIDQERMLRFVSDPDWSGLQEGRKLNRSTDWQESLILKTGNLVASASAGRVNFIRAIERAGIVSTQIVVVNRQEFLTGGENLIFYGAPGTGKSYTVEKLIDEHRTIRTVFHPDTQNSDFIGALKPIIVDGDVSYAFSPGPFSKSMVAAYNQPSVMHYLVIEELNRAPAAAVFGELFQMLDRDGNGAGEYSVDFPSEEFANWWQARTSRNESKMRLPSNLSILATMNSADQGVFPLDTAFRRRWKQEYIPIDYDNVPAGHVQIALKAGDIVNVGWGIFIKKLNNFLVDQIGATISEDRLIGPWFLSSAELDGAIPNKLLIYLWDDLLRHHGREIIFASRIKTVGSFASAQKDKKPIFSGAFLALFQNDLGADE